MTFEIGLHGSRGRGVRSANAQRRDDPLIDPELLTRSRALHIVDARDFDALNANCPNPDLSDAVAWRARLSAVGLGADTPAAVIDDGNMCDAAHLWFILQHFGLFARIVDGGWRALAETNLLAARAYADEPIGALEPGSGAVQLIDKPALRRALASDTLIIHAQAREARTSPSHPHRADTISLPLQNFFAGYRVKPIRDLQAIFSRARIKAYMPVIVCADTLGASAALAAILLRAGFDDVSVYVGAISEWAGE